MCISSAYRSGEECLLRRARSFDANSVTMVWKHGRRPRGILIVSSEYRFARTKIVGIATNPGEFGLFHTHCISLTNPHIIDSYRWWLVSASIHSYHVCLVLFHHVCSFLAVCYESADNAV